MVRFITRSFLILLVSLQLWGNDKTVWDILPEQHGEHQTPEGLARIPYPGLDYLMLGNSYWETTLLRGGYFTLGTTAGLSASELDDACPLTYGHPFAMTSFPWFALDGQAFKPDSYFYNETVSLVGGADSVSVEMTSATLEMTFRLYFTDNGETLKLDLRITNLDAATHTITPGVVLDPALGKWGDASVSIGSVPLTGPTSYSGDLPDSEIILDERRLGSSGLGMGISFPSGQTLPDLEVENWHQLIRPDFPGVDLFYDVALRFTAESQSLASGETASFELRIHLREPDFPDGPFLRSQLPNALTETNGLVFPRQFQAFTEVYNNSGSTLNALAYTLRTDQLSEDWTGTSFALGSHSKQYHHIPVNLPEIFENRVYPLTLELNQNGQPEDILVRNCFIPASPYSDTGLVVSVDSILLADYPQVSARFSASIENTGQYLFNLETENVFLYEDQSRILDYSLIRDTTGNTDAADVVFVLDVTGSMGGEINGVKDNLSEFTDRLAEQGVDFRLAMVTFLDVVENIYDFTSDVELFQTYIDDQYAHGGGDWRENSLDALYTASQLQFRDAASRIFIWITDAGYHIESGPTDLSVEQVVDALLANAITCHAVAGSDIRVEYCEPISLPTGGDWFDINGNFQDILLTIAELGGTNKYLISYAAPAAGETNRSVTVEVHYAGLGGTGALDYTVPASVLARPVGPGVRCYPNPFNPSVVIQLSNPQVLEGVAQIYNLRGQLVQNFTLAPVPSQTLIWNAQDYRGRSVPTGVYFLRVRFDDTGGAPAYQQLFKLVHSR